MTLISIHDKSLNRVAYIDNTLPLALHSRDEDWFRSKVTGNSVFSFTVDKTGHETERFLIDENYLSFKHKGFSYLFNIMDIFKDDEKFVIKAENISFELLNETKQGIDIVENHSLIWYLNNDNIIEGAGLTIGINEVSDQLRKIKIESEQTGLARLLSLVTNFGAEHEFITNLNSDGTLESIVINFYKKFDGVNQGSGTNREDLILYYGKNVDGVSVSSSKVDMFNAITPIGKDGANIKDIERTIFDDNGNVEYFTKKGSYAIYAPLSMERYPSKLVGTYNNYTHREHKLEGTSDSGTLFTLGLNELRKHAYPAIVYEVTGFFDLEVGDTVKIQDDSFDPAIILKARVMEQHICFSDPSKNKTVFGNILALESKISQDLTGRLKQLVDQATPYRFEIVSDNGLTFKNSTGSTTLTARVYKGSNVDEVSVDSFEWLLDGVKFGGTTKSQLVNASQVSGTAIVRYNAKIGNTVIGGMEATLQDVSDGTDGISPINLVIESSNGYQFKNNIINTTFTAILYQNNTEIDSDSTKFSYIWSKTKSDGTVDTAWNLAHQTSQKTITITNSDVWQRATFDCTAEPLN